MKTTHYGQHGEGCFGCKVKTIQLCPTSAFQPHFNHSIGAYVNTQREFDGLLRRRAEENTIATGTEHRYESVDPEEAKRSLAPTTETEAVNNQARAMEKAGMPVTTGNKVFS